MPHGDPLVCSDGETGICCYRAARDIVDANFPLRPILQVVDFEVHSMEAGPIARGSFLSSTLQRMFGHLNPINHISSLMVSQTSTTMLGTRYAE